MVDIEGLRCLDLFAGTGAVSFELLSRGAASVTSVEKSATQARFIEKVKQELGDRNLHLLRTDALRFIRDSSTAFDFVFADPPYDLDDFGDIPSMVLGSNLLHSGSIFIIEHSKKYDFSSLPHFTEHRAYGSVNFSIFEIPEESEAATFDDTPAE